MSFVSPCQTSASAVGSSGAANEIRIRLFESAEPRALSLSVADGSFLLDTSGDMRGVPVEPDESVLVRRDGALLMLTVRGAPIRVTSVVLTPGHADAAFSLSVTEGSRRLSRVYDGKLEVRVAPDSNELLVINTVSLETYVAAVVSSEYGLDDVEGTRAMAVLARTYALRQLGAPGDLFDHVDHELSQVYRGREGLDERAVAAATRTTGEVLLYSGELAEAVYHASSGGHTADNDAVWAGSPVPYLRGATDPFAGDNPYTEWNFRADRRRLLRALSDQVGARVTGLLVDEKSDDGRVASVKLTTQGEPHRMSGNDFRLIVIREFGARSLMSMLFTVAVAGDAYEFRGSGFGHGVGLSQWGAHEMAKRGYDYRDILAFYFRGTEVRRIPELFPDVTPLPAATPPIALRRPDRAEAGASVRAVENGDDVDKDTTRRARTRRIGW